VSELVFRLRLLPVDAAASKPMSEIFDLVAFAQACAPKRRG
jgi:hypothetical protein